VFLILDFVEKHFVNPDGKIKAIAQHRLFGTYQVGIINYKMIKYKNGITDGDLR
jgi:hypothetical protein